MITTSKVSELDEENIASDVEIAANELLQLWYQRNHDERTNILLSLALYHTSAVKDVITTF
jgi:hypothetical protein